MARPRLESNIARYLSTGAEIAASLAVPIAAGYLLDRRLDTSPWFLLIGCVVGIALFIAIAVRLAGDRPSSTHRRSE